jgi:hypothetical protein
MYSPSVAPVDIDEMTGTPGKYFEVGHGFGA